MDISGELRKGPGLHQVGRLAEAGDIYARVLEAEPDNADALNLMGVVLQADGNCVGVIALLRRATELAPDYFTAYVNLGNAQQGVGQLEDSVQALQAAIRLNSNAPVALNNLCNPLIGLGRAGELLGVPGHRRVLGGRPSQSGQRAHGDRLDQGSVGQLRPIRGPGRGQHGQALQPG